MWHNVAHFGTQKSDRICLHRTESEVINLV